MVDLKKPIDFKDPAAPDFLARIQGNILKGHGRDHTAHLFLRFPAAAAPVRGWITRFANGELITADEQRLQTEAFRAARAAGKPIAGQPFASFLLSYAGYRALEIPAERIPKDSQGFFQVGLKRHNSAQADQINDPDPSAWEAGYRNELHAMVLLADDIRTRLDGTVKSIVDALGKLNVESFVERGDKLRFDFGPPRGLLEIEHFGHQDGISNPRMTVEDIDEEVKDRGANLWDPSAPLNLVLTEEPGAAKAYGSFMVFRKLEQNVRTFTAAKKALATLLRTDPDGAAALMVGRHRDGTPVIPTTTLTPGADPNNFNFGADAPPRGTPARLCPFHAHIRRTNPRGDVARYVPGQTEEFERSMRIARRGITYGERPHLYDTEPWALPEREVGLLFMSFQADLRQFAIQQGGSDDETFPFVGPPPAFSGLESVVGQAASGATVRPQPWPYRDPNDPAAIREYKMMNFVKMLGGEYFFAPSVPFLQSLGPA